MVYTAVRLWQKNLAGFHILFKEIDSFFAEKHYFISKKAVKIKVIILLTILFTNTL